MATLNIEVESRRVACSLYELKKWKKNRDLKTIERANDGGQKRQLTSGALDRAIGLLEHYEKVLSKLNLKK